MFVGVNVGVLVGVSVGVGVSAITLMVTKLEVRPPAVTVMPWAPAVFKAAPLENTWTPLSPPVPLVKV